MRVQHLQGAEGQAPLVKPSHGVFTGGGGNGKARRTGLVTDMHRTGIIISLFVTQAVSPNCHSLHCYAKEKEKFTSEDKMVLLFKQSQCLCNSSLNGKVQLEPGTCCLQKYQVMSNNVKCSKWC